VLQAIDFVLHVLAAPTLRQGFSRPGASDMAQTLVMLVQQSKLPQIYQVVYYPLASLAISEFDRCKSISNLRDC